jgi:hypothetical protein
MGISIKLYAVGKAETIHSLQNIESELTACQNKIDLYKMTSDLAVIFANKVDPYEGPMSIQYKILFGYYEPLTAGRWQIGGFIPSSEVSGITNWIKQHKIDSREGFDKMYADLSGDVKQELEDMASPTPEDLFSGYVRPLTEFYFKAEKNGNSIVICGE